MRAQFAPPRFRIEMPVGPTSQRNIWRQGQRQAFRHDDLGRRDALERRRQLRRRHFAQAEVAARQIQPGQSGELASRTQGEQQGVPLFVEQRRVGQGAGRDDAHDGALDRALARRRIAHLLADRHRLTQSDQLGQVLLDCVIGHAGHPDRLPGRLTTRRQRDVEQARRLFGVGEEQLVEITHPVKKQDIRMLRLDPQVLLHHWRVRCRRAWRDALIIWHGDSNASRG